MAYVICWHNEDASDWEVIDGEDAMQQRVNELLNEGYDVPYVFDDTDELDRSEA